MRPRQGVEHGMSSQWTAKQQKTAKSSGQAAEVDKEGHRKEAAPG